MIFYNGSQEQPDRKILRLSDAYCVKEEHPALELTAVMLNINRGHNEKLKEMCKSLKDYSEYTARVREYAQVKPVEEAVEQAISECIQEGIMAEFLKQNRAEAKQVSIYEYDEEKTLRMFREEGYEDGERNGKIQATIEMCLEFNLSSDAIVQKLMTKFQFSENQAQEYLDNYIAQNS